MYVLSPPLQSITHQKKQQLIKKFGKLFLPHHSPQLQYSFCWSETLSVTYYFLWSATHLMTL